MQIVAARQTPCYLASTRPRTTSSSAQPVEEIRKLISRYAAFSELEDLLKTEGAPATSYRLF